MRTTCGALLLLLLLLPACEGRGGEGIPEPQYGKDVCAECGSILQDPNFAALYRLPGGAQKVFDDPGCLFRSLRSEASQPSDLRFHEHGGTRWLSGDQATFAKTPETESPQGYGWAAYASFGDAQTAVTSAGSGEILSFAQARDKIGAAAP